MASNIHYKGESIAKGSEAYALWEAKDFKKLDRHSRELDEKEVALIKRYQRSEDVPSRPEVNPAMDQGGLGV